MGDLSHAVTYELLESHDDSSEAPPEASEALRMGRPHSEDGNEWIEPTQITESEHIDAVRQELITGHPSNQPSQHLLQTKARNSRTRQPVPPSSGEAEKGENLRQVEELERRLGHRYSGMENDAIKADALLLLLRQQKLLPLFLHKTTSPLRCQHRKRR